MSSVKFSAFWLLAIVLGAGFFGCRESKPVEVPVPATGMSKAELEALRRAPLKVLLVGSPIWGEEIKVQFEGRGEATLDMKVMDTAEWATTSAESLDAFDVLLMPPDRLAPLAVQEKLLKYPNALLDKIGHSQWFPVDRRLGRIEQNVYGISLGTPVCSVLVNPAVGVSDAEAPQVPKTWAEWQMAAEQDRQAGRPLRWVEPMNGLNPAFSLLLRVASMAKNQSQSDVFYSRGDGEPRLTTPPFVKALEELKATYGPSVAEVKEWSVTDLLAKLQAGSIQGALLPLPRLDDVGGGVANLQPEPPPGATRFYDFFDQTWSNRSAGVFRTQVVGLSGHVVCVLRRTRKSEAAFRLVELLTTPPTAEVFAPLSEHVLVSRSEQWANASNWVGRQYSVDATDKIKQLVQLANDDVLGGAEFFPSLPGNPERLQALTDAVWQVLEDRQEPVAALQECQKKWIEIGKQQGPPTPLTIFSRYK